MAKISLKDYRKDRVNELMDKFLEETTLATSMTCAGYKFIETHRVHMKAAEIIHDMEQEGLLYDAEELYPEHREKMQTFLDIYEEEKGFKE